jgi:protein ImuA
MIPRRDPHALAALKSRLRSLETAGGQGGVVPFGLPEIDRWLPGGGLPRIGIHEVIAGRGAGAGFAAALAGRLGSGPVLWVARQAELYGPGLAHFGLAPERLILVQAGPEAEILWAMEEGLRMPGLAAVVGELHGLDLTAGRRLQLAAEAGGGTGLVLRPADSQTGAGAACSRWRVGPAPSAPGANGSANEGANGGGGWTCWRLALERCRGVAGAPDAWIVECRDATGDFALAAETGDRPAAPARPPAADADRAVA